MKIDIFQSDSVFETIASEEWNTLLSSATTNVIFLTWEWQSTWWKHINPGEILVAVFRDDSGLLQGIVPLFRSQSPDGQWVLSIIGCEDVSDYLDFIVLPEQEETICSELLSFLNSEKAPGWDKIQLCNLPVDSTAYRILREQASALDLAVQNRIQDRCPVIELPGDWEEYLANLDKKQRHEIRRKMRKAEAQADVNWYVANSHSHNIADEISTFIELHRLSSPKKNVFMDSRMTAFFSEIAQVLLEKGWLHLSFIEVDNQKSAGLFSFNYNNHFQVYNSGYDPHKFGHLSPGIILMAYCIRQAIETGHKTFDFLRGEEEYKYRMGAKPTDIFELTISRNKPE